MHYWSYFEKNAIDFFRNVLKQTLDARNETDQVSTAHEPLYNYIYLSCFSTTRRLGQISDIVVCILKELMAIFYMMNLSIHTDMIVQTNPFLNFVHMLTSE